MDDRIVFEEAGRLHRYFLNWRQGALLGYLVFLVAVVLLVRHLWDSVGAVLAILLLSVPVGLVLAIADLRSRRLSLASMEAAKLIESGRKGHVYASLARERVPEEPGLQRWGLAPVYWTYSLALLVAAGVIALGRFYTTGAELAPWVLAIGSLCALVAAFLIGRAQHASTVRRLDYEQERREEDAARQCLEFGSAVVESISELQRGTEFKNKDMVARQESRLRDLMLFAQSIGVRDVKSEALSPFVALRGVAAEAAADAHATVENWPNAAAGSRFEVLMKRAGASFGSLEAALSPVSTGPLERPAMQPDEGRVLRRVTI